MSQWTMTLYGADTKPTASITGFPLKTNVEALTGVQSFTVTPIHLHPEPELDVEEKKYINGYSKANKRIRLKFSMEIYPASFPTSTTAIETFYPVNVINKEYNWINIPASYYLIPNSITINQQLYCMEVVITGLTVDHKDPNKSLTIDFKFAYES